MLPAMPKSELIRFDHEHTPKGKIADSPQQIERVRKRKMTQSQNKSRYQTVRLRVNVKRSGSAAS
jgi:hypothetical protein